jgi:uroporphyrinogen decarboxylase
MNPRERVLAALEHQQPDKTPWHLEFTEPALAKLADHYSQPRLTNVEFFDEWVGNHFRIVEPRCKAHFHGLEEEVKPGLWRDKWGIIWDTRGLYGEGEWGRPVNCVLPEPTLAHYTVPALPGPEAFEHYSRFADENREYFRMAYFVSLYEHAWALRGMENFLIDMVVNPQFVDDLLESITDWNLAFIERSVKYDIDAFGFGDDLGSQTMGLIMGPDHWRRFFKPRLARMFARVKEGGKYVRLHSDGQVDAIFEDLVEIGLDIYNPFQPEIRDVYQTKRNYGDRLSFHGGIGIQELLPYGTPLEVKAEVRRLIEEVGANGGYILGPAHAVMADTPLENLVALIEAVQDQ